MPKKLERKLKAQAKKQEAKGKLSKKDEGAYIYGTMAKIEKAKKRKK